MILLLTFKIHWSKDDIIHIVIITSMMSIILYRWANPLDLTRDSSPGQIGYSASQQSLDKNNSITAGGGRKCGFRDLSYKSDGDLPGERFKWARGAASGENPRTTLDRSSVLGIGRVYDSSHPVSIRSDTYPQSLKVAANLRVRKTPTESILHALFNLISW